MSPRACLTLLTLALSVPPAHAQPASGWSNYGLGRNDPPQSYSYGVIPMGGIGWRNGSIQRANGIVTVEMFSYYRTPVNGTRWRFQTLRIACLAKTAERLSGTDEHYSGATRPVPAAPARPITPETESYIPHMALCTGTSLSDVKQAADRAALNKAMAAL